MDVEVVDLRTISPLDRETFLESVRKTSKAIVVYEDYHTYGVGAEVAATIAQDTFHDLDAPVMRLAGPDVPAMGLAPTLEAEFMLSPEKIANAMRELAAY